MMNLFQYLVSNPISTFLYEWENGYDLKLLRLFKELYQITQNDEEQSSEHDVAKENWPGLFSKIIIGYFVLT